MKYLLDTNIIVDQLRGKTAVDPKIIRQGIAISAITYGELLYGAYKSDNQTGNLSFLEGLLTDFSIEIIPVSPELMKEFAKTKASLENKGNRLDDFDLLIAATAISNHLTLKTGNFKYFARIPDLSVE